MVSWGKVIVCMTLLVLLVSTLDTVEAKKREQKINKFDMESLR